MYLVADQYGIGFRGLLRTHNIDWSDIQSITVRRSGFNGPTLRITRADGSYADVPPSLMLPTKPTGTVKTLAQLGDTARMIIDYGQARSLARLRTAAAGAAAGGLRLEAGSG